MGREIITPLAITGAFRLPWQQYSSAAIELRDYEVNTKYLSANEIYKNKYIRSRVNHLPFTAFTRNYHVVFDFCTKKIITKTWPWFIS